MLSFMRRKKTDPLADCLAAILEIEGAITKAELREAEAKEGLKTSRHDALLAGEEPKDARKYLDAIAEARADKEALQSIKGDRREVLRDLILTAQSDAMAVYDDDLLEAVQGVEELEEGFRYHFCRAMALHARLRNDGALKLPNPVIFQRPEIRDRIKTELADTPDFRSAQRRASASQERIHRVEPIDVFKIVLDRARDGEILKTADVIQMFAEGLPGEQEPAQPITQEWSAGDAPTSTTPQAEPVETPRQEAGSWLQRHEDSPQAAGATALGVGPDINEQDFPADRAPRRARVEAGQITFLNGGTE